MCSTPLPKDLGAGLLAGLAARGSRPEYAQLLADCQRLYCEVRLICRCSAACQAACAQRTLVWCSFEFASKACVRPARPACLDGLCTPCMALVAACNGLALHRHDPGSIIATIVRSHASSQAGALSRLCPGTAGPGGGRHRAAHRRVCEGAAAAAHAQRLRVPHAGARPWLVVLFVVSWACCAAHRRSSKAMHFCGQYHMSVPGSHGLTVRGKERRCTCC